MIYSKNYPCQFLALLHCFRRIVRKYLSMFSSYLMYCNFLNEIFIVMFYLQCYKIGELVNLLSSFPIEFLYYSFSTYLQF